MNLADPWWRLENLYCCKEEGTGKMIPFTLRPEQREVLKHLYERPDDPAYIVKSRRLGLSTGIGIGMTDFGLWNGGAICSLVERSGQEAKKKMKTILQFALDSMPREMRNRFETPVRNTQEMAVKVAGLADEYLSTIYSGTVARGSDCSWLWSSEAGPMAVEDAGRFEELVTGAWPAARKGKRVIETTWMGGKGGGLWDLIRPVLEKDPEAEGTIFFFPWHGDPQCVRLDGGAVSKEMEEYFTSLGEKLGKTFTREQKRWYAVTAKTQGLFMKREYPSTLDEAFSAPVEGSIYGEAVDTARAEGRVRKGIPIDGNGLVHTAWDLGAPLQTVVWYFQLVGSHVRLVDVDRELDLTLVQRVARMKAKGYAFGNHFLPHDAKQTDRTGRTLASELAQTWLNVDAAAADPAMLHHRANLKFVPRTHDIWVGINHALQLFPAMEFRTETCDEAISVLAMYRMEKVDPGKRVQPEPVHDWTSHTADALRTLAEAHLAGMFSFAGEKKPEWEYLRDHRVKRGMKEIRVG